MEGVPPSLFKHDKHYDSRNQENCFSNLRCCHPDCDWVDCLQNDMGSVMTPSEQAKILGLDSLAELVRLSMVSEQTLINWHKNKPRLFECVCLGAVAFKKQGSLTSSPVDK